MRVSVEIFCLPKDGNSREEYEDAFWPEISVSQMETVGFCCAVADGATEASFSGSWARMLCRQYCAPVDSDRIAHFCSQVPQRQKEWELEFLKRPLPWFAEEKARSGAFSSILGLSIKECRINGDFGLHWEAFAVGDSCLVYTHESTVMLRFPLERSDEFNNSPYLLGSTRPIDESSPHHRRSFGRCESGDKFYLMTDALACWFFRGYEEKRDESIHWLSDFSTQDEFEKMVSDERLARESEGKPLLRNDDVTLLRLEVGCTASNT